MVFNATFNNISVIPWWSFLLVEENGDPWENHRPVSSHWQTLSPCDKKIKKYKIKFFLYLHSFQLYVTKTNCVLFCNTFRQYSIFIFCLIMKKTLLYFFGLLLFSLYIRAIYHEDISLHVSISLKAFQT